MMCCFSHSVTVTICLKTLFFFHLQYQNPGPGGILLPRLWSHRWFRHFSHHRPLFTNQETPGVYWGKSITYWRGKHYAARKQTEKKRNWYLVQRAYGWKITEAMDQKSQKRPTPTVLGSPHPFLGVLHELRCSRWGWSSGMSLCCTSYPLGVSFPIPGNICSTEIMSLRWLNWPISREGTAYFCSALLLVFCWLPQLIVPYRGSRMCSSC